MPGAVFHALRDLWRARGGVDEFIGTLINAYLSDGGTAVGVRAGEAYVDVGTFNGYRAALSLLRAKPLAMRSARHGPPVAPADRAAASAMRG